MGVSLKKKFCHHTNACCGDNLRNYHCIVFLLPFNGNSIYNRLEFASKLTENVVILGYNFSLSDCHFSLIFLEGEITLLSGPSLNPVVFSFYMGHVMRRMPDTQCRSACPSLGQLVLTLRVKTAFIE